jgi:hypothetical protein
MLGVKIKGVLTHFVSPHPPQPADCLTFEFLVRRQWFIKLEPNKKLKLLRSVKSGLYING